MRKSVEVHVRWRMGVALACLFCATADADELDNWHLRHSEPGGPFLRSVAYGNDTFVAVGEKGKILTSKDGSEWQEASSGVMEDLNGVGFGNGLFVAVGPNQRSLTSPDGLSWTSRNSGTAGPLLSVSYGKAGFLAIGSGFGSIQLFGSSSDYRSFLSVSPDGIRWSVIPKPIEGNLITLTHANGLWVAGGGEDDFGETRPLIATSVDATNWTRTIFWEEVPAGRVFVRAITHGKGKFVALGTGRSGYLIYTSTDGLDWVRVRTPLSMYIWGATFGFGNFLAVGLSGDPSGAPEKTIFSSTDGVNWTAHNSGVSAGFFSVAYGQGSFVAVGTGTTIIQSDRVDLRGMLEIRKPSASDPLEITVLGCEGCSYEIQALEQIQQTNNWTRLTTITLSTNGSSAWIDPGSSDAESKYYRAIRVVN